MAEFTSHPPGTPSWVDLMSPDIDASKAFYQSAFGWDAEDQLDPEGNRVYVMFSVNGKGAAGLGGQPPDMGPMPALWNTYITVADVVATTEAVTSAGGSVVMPAMQVMEAGEMAVFTDPTGAAFSVWKPGQHIGAEIGNEPNTFSWNELMTRDIDTAKAFYSQVFGWEYDSMDMGAGGIYNVISGGESGGLGGLMAMPAEIPAEVPNHWMVYFSVADIEASLKTITEAGGTLLNGPMAIPGVGSMATIHDPQGGAFSLMEPEAQD
ncbi:MAG: VOC family protein [Actinomycetia bacterium]|nr:VOC family protein [Actinomycetes bacterium]